VKLLKSFKKIIKWSILALVIELGGFFYVDKFYLKEITSFNIKPVEVNQVEDKKKVEVQIPLDSKSISISYDGRFVAYILNDGVKIVNRESGKDASAKLFTGTKASYIYWYSNSDRLVISEKGTNFIKFCDYDALRDTSDQWQDNKEVPVKIVLPNTQYQVKDMIASPKMGVKYINIGNSTKNTVYEFDIMSRNINKINYPIKLGRIGMMQLNDRFIHEDLTKKQLYIEDFPNIFKDKTLINPCFLGADFDDIAYLGSRAGDKVTKIYYGPLETPISDWKIITLSTSTTKENIIVDGDGNIYENNSLSGTIINLKTNKSSDYSGNFISIYNKGIVSMEDNTLKENKLN